VRSSFGDNSFTRFNDSVGGYRFSNVSIVLANSKRPKDIGVMTGFEFIQVRLARCND
jgi:hypothetical protein